jgi:hypothetical protein
MCFYRRIPLSFVCAPAFDILADPLILEDEQNLIFIPHVQPLIYLVIGIYDGGVSTGIYLLKLFSE